ncbi:hypothetical protein V9A52_18800 [Klebsiella pneumoniae]
MPEFTGGQHVSELNQQATTHTAQTVWPVQAQDMQPEIGQA